MRAQPAACARPYICAIFSIWGAGQVLQQIELGTEILLSSSPCPAPAARRHGKSTPGTSTTNSLFTSGVLTALLLPNPVLQQG